MSGAIIGGVISGSLFALIAMGLVVIFRCSHSINFAQGDIGALGAFLSLSLTTAGAHVVPVWLAVVIGILVSAAANLILYLGYVQFLEKRGTGNIYVTLVGTLGIALIIENALPLKYGYTAYSLPLFGGVGGIKIAGVNVPASALAIVASAALALGVFTLVLYRTRAGLLLRMGASDPRLTTLSGLRIHMIRAVAWAVAGGLSAWGVMLYSSYQNITTGTMGTFVLYAAVAASWGAFRSVTWTVVGALATGIVGNVVDVYASATLENTVALVMLTLAIGFRVWRRGSRVSSGEIESRGLARTTRVRHPKLAVTEVVLAICCGLVAWLLAGSAQVGLLQEACYTIIAMTGIAICLRFGGRLALCAGGIMGLAGYISAYNGLPAVVMVILAVAVSVLVGVVLGTLTAKMELIYYANITLLITVSVPELAQVFTSLTGGQGGEAVPPLLTGTLLGGRSAEALLMVVVTCAVLAAFAIFGRGNLGRSLAAVGRDSTLAISAGLRPIAVRALIEGLGLGLMGLAGVFWAQQASFLTPQAITIYFSNILVAGVIVAGGWTVSGLVIGGAFLVELPSVLAPFNGGLPGIVFGAVLVLVVLAAPEGVEGALRRLYLGGAGASTSLRRQFGELAAK